MENWKKKAIELVTKQLTADANSASVVPYYPQKTVVLGMSERYFKRVRPQRHKISPSRIYAMLCELEEEERANVQSIAVVAGGDIIAECSQPGYSVNMPHLSHSMSKTVTGLAVGMLVDDGKLSLDARVSELLPEYKYKDKLFAKMTVEDLLKMSSGIGFAEAGCVTSACWEEAFFESGLKYEPGTEFSYNSMNTYILSRIVCKITEKSLSEFLDERLFAPLHIKQYHWERSASGIEKGGWGLYLSCEDWAKLGFMMLRGGVFEGKRILSQKWVNLSSSLRNVSDGRLGDFDYGYQMWVGKDGSDFLFNGMFGQNVWICPKNDIVVSLCCGNNELFQRSPTLGIIRKYLGCDMQDNDIKTSYFALMHKEKHFFETRMPVLRKPKPNILYRLRILREKPISDEWAGIEGEYKFPKNNIGILPFFVRLMQNNLASELQSLKIERLDTSILFTFTESSREYKIRAGLREYYTSEHDFRGEKYLISAMCGERTDTEGGRIYRLALIFPELPNSEIIELKPTVGGINLSFNENPGKKIVDTYISASEMSPIAMIAMSLIKRKAGDNFLEQALGLMFSPEIMAVNAGDTRCDEMLQEQNDIFDAMREKYRGLAGIISKLVGEAEDTPKASPFAFFGSLFKKKRVAALDDADVTEELGNTEVTEPSVALSNDNFYRDSGENN